MGIVGIINWICTSLAQTSGVFAMLFEYTDRFGEINKELRRLEREKAIYIEKNTIHPTYYYYTEECRKRKQTECAGDRIHADINRRLDIVDDLMFDRSNDQRKFHETIIIGNLQNIYKTEFNMNVTRIMTEMAIDIIRKYLLIIAARRTGKTTTIGVILAIFMLAIPGVEIAVFSSCTRLSVNMLNLVDKVGCIFPEWMPLRKVKNQEMLKLILPNKDIRTLRSLPNAASKYFFFFNLLL
jgi:hypothetical protein